jgi:outer membrane protein
MKQHIVWGILAALFLSAPVLAADGLKMGYVDMRAVLTESKSGKQHRAELESFIKDKQAALRKEEDKLNAMKQSLEKEQLTLSDKQKQDKQRDFQAKVQAFQKLAGEADQELRKKDADYTNKAVEDVRKIIADLAKSEKINIVLAKTDMTVLYADDGMDLTQKVIDKFDAQSAKK